MLFCICKYPCWNFVLGVLCPVLALLPPGKYWGARYLSILLITNIYAPFGVLVDDASLRSQALCSRCLST